MSSCQDFLIPAAEGGVAVGMDPRFPTASFIKLGFWKEQDGSLEFQLDYDFEKIKIQKPH